MADGFHDYCEAACALSHKELRARIAHLQENNARLAEIAVELGEQRDRLSAENAELSSHLEEATQSGIDTALEITETLSKRLDEVEAENAGLREDEARMNWLENHGWAAQWPAKDEALSCLTGWHRSDEIGIRQSIDAARGAK
jgi:hypothetical protein